MSRPAELPFLPPILHPSWMRHVELFCQKQFHQSPRQPKDSPCISGARGAAVARQNARTPPGFEWPWGGELVAERPRKVHGGVVVWQIPQNTKKPKETPSQQKPFEKCCVLCAVCVFLWVQCQFKTGGRNKSTPRRGVPAPSGGGEDHPLTASESQ